MKGLLIKDLYMIINYCRTSFLLDAVFIAFSFFVRENIYFLMFPILISGIMPITLLSLDEKFGWLKYSGTTPCKKAFVVSEKYLIGLIMQFATSLLIMAVSLIGTCFTVGLDLASSAAAVGIFFAVSLLFPAFCLPFCFWLGTEKGRICYLILTGVMVGSFMSIVTFGEIPKIGTAIVAAAALAIIAVYAISWAISIRIFKKKETA